MFSTDFAGPQKYYIFAAGTYKVGRKDCDVIVQTDTSISRVHAEIAIEKMVAWDQHSGAPASPSYVRVVDCSKYGTFVNKVQGTQGSQLRKDVDVMLPDGDSVTFGTGNTTFRLSLVPIVVFFHGKKSARIDPSLQVVMASIGAYATCKWSDECTHVVVDESSPLTPELLDAILTKKQIILGGWFKIKMEIKLIESCLAGYTFILGSSEKYKFGEKLHPLLELTGAKYLHIDKFYANSQMDAILKYEIDRTGAGDNDQQILLVPAKSPLEFSKICALFPLSKITDVKLFAAILSGRLEATAIEPPAFDTATSDHTVAASKSQHHMKHSSDDKMEDTVRTTEDAVNLGETKANINIHNDLEKDEVLKPMEDDVKVIEKAAMYGFKARGEHVRVINMVPKDENLETSRNETCDVIFSQDLVVKSILQSAPAMSIETGGINFKRFRNRQGPCSICTRTIQRI